MAEETAHHRFIGSSDEDSNASAEITNDRQTSGDHLTVNHKDLKGGLKSAGSAVDLSSTLRGTTFASAGTTSRKEYYWNLFWEHKHSTVTLCLVFWSFGMCVAFLGPTLLDLGCKTGTVFSTMSWVFFSQSFFVLIGSACGGFMLKRFSADIILLIGISMMAATMAAIPLCNALWALTLVLAIMGLFMGTIDTVANVTMICLYEKDVSPFLQAIHFFYGVGAFVSPMIAQPFLLNEDCSPFLNNNTEPIFDDNETRPAATLDEARRMTHIDYAFWIMALLMAPVILLTFSLVGKRYLTGAYQRRESHKQSEYESMAGGNGVVPELKHEDIVTNHYSIVLVTILTAMLMFLYDGLQAAYGGYIYSYAVKGPAKFHKTNAAYLNALFWGMFATGRLLSIALATKLSPAHMLFGNIMGCTIALLLMLSLRYSHVMLIVGTGMLGVFMSSVFPTALSLTEQYIRVTPTTTSFLVFGAAVGEMTMPVCVGHEFELNGPTSLLVVGLVLCFISIIAYMTLWLAGLTLLKPDYPNDGSVLPWKKFCKRLSTSDLVILFSKCMPGSVTGQPEGESAALANQNVQYYSRMQGNEGGTSPDDSTGSIAFLKRDDLR